MSSLVSVTKEDWTFRDISTKEYTHGFHQYPARMHPEIAKRLIEKYAIKSSDIVFDPFMGSGGVLVESMLHGNNSVGIDLNPFAVLLSTVKTTPLDTAKLEDAFNQIITNSKKDKKNKIEHKNAPNFLPKKPKEETLKFWYQDDALRDIQILKNYVFLIKDKKTRDFFKICFSLATRKVSFQKNSIYKIYRMKPDKRKLFKPNVLDEFSKICKNNIKNMNEFSNTLGTNYSKAIPILGNTFAAPELLDGKKPTLVVTSPPYGDHGTTVAYGQFSRHPGMWLELEDSDELFAVDTNGLGGQKKKSIEDLHSETLDKTLKKIKEKDSQVPRRKLMLTEQQMFIHFFMI